MQCDSDQPTDEQMQGIIEIEKPFHTFPFSPLSVVAFQQGNGKSDEKLQSAIDRIDKAGIDKGVSGYPQHHSGHLSSKIPPVFPYVKNSEYGDTAPIGTKGKDSDS